MSDLEPVEGEQLPDKAAGPLEHMQCLSRRQRVLVELAVWEGLPFRDAAKKAGLSERQGFRLLHDADVLRAIKAERQVLLNSERVANIHALRRVRDESKNSLAVVQAARAIQDLAERDATPGAEAGQAIGYVIHIVGQAPSTGHQITSQPGIAASPLIEHEPVPIQAGYAPLRPSFPARRADAEDADEVPDDDDQARGAE